MLYLLQILFIFYNSYRLKTKTYYLFLYLFLYVFCSKSFPYIMTEKFDFGSRLTLKVKQLFSMTWNSLSSVDCR